MNEIDYDKKFTWKDKDGIEQSGDQYLFRPGQKRWFACPTIIEEIEIVSIADPSGFFCHWKVNLAGNEIIVNEESLFFTKQDAIKHIHHILLINVNDAQRQMVVAKGALLRFEQQFITDIHFERVQ